MTPRERQINSWRREKFPDATEWDIFKKLTEEAGELAEAMALRDVPAICHEAADCKIVLENLLGYFGHSLQDHSERVWRLRRERD